MMEIVSQKDMIDRVKRNILKFGAYIDVYSELDELEIDEMLIKKSQVHYLGNCYFVEVLDKMGNCWRGMFTATGEQVYIQDGFEETFRRLDDNNFYCLPSRNSKNGQVKHYQYDSLTGNFLIKEFMIGEGINVSQVMMINEDLVEFRLNNSVGLEKGYYLYNQKLRQELFLFNDIDKTHINYPDYLLISKELNVEGNIATLKFYVDKEGRIVSEVFDYERATLYPLEVLEKPIQSLDFICNKVVRMLAQENKERLEEEQKKGYMRKFFKEYKIKK